MCVYIYICMKQTTLKQASRSSRTHARSDNIDNDSNTSNALSTNAQMVSIKQASEKFPDPRSKRTRN